MKKITLVRHAKSSWKYDVNDIDRPLKKRGIVDANLVSNAFYVRESLPNIVFSSPANRALTTCKIFMKNLNIDSKIVHVNDKLYDFGGQNVVDFIKKCDDTYNHIMIFGHNHAFTSISNIFGDIFIANLPTSGLVEIIFDVDSWTKISNGKTLKTIFPRDLK
ncbi:SixA phosphatase family protein [Ichthyenterobacterium magnum]|uniref:Phosphohistidine phosphatase n=1 Tax=Ichthyenterobacterium magnum TaxID=1230530 RepID=A0A420DKC8_9FLAO|nr:histidine phosphatase family protein [Ichthyenterobacterium magnum]RKE94700.1 phosphohistidine phosphatase [Ichthyenterobacterium magnum]